MACMNPRPCARVRLNDRLAESQTERPRDRETERPRDRGAPRAGLVAHGPGPSATQLVRSPLAAFFRGAEAPARGLCSASSTGGPALWRDNQGKPRAWIPHETPRGAGCPGGPPRGTPAPEVPLRQGAAPRVEERLFALPVLSGQKPQAVSARACRARLCASGP